MPKITNCQHDSFDPHILGSFDAIVVGAGFAGAVAARQLAERGGLRVAVVEKRHHVAGNAYDCINDHGVFIHEYGPHIFHTTSKRVFDYLSRFTQWRHYEHEVKAFINGAYVPVPFNLNSIDLSFEAEKARAISTSLIKSFGMGTKIPIIELRQNDNPLLRELADYVYENVFLHYTLKQWGLTPDQIDPAVTARVPVLVDRDNRYFQDPWQGIPAQGYTALVNNMLNHPGIEVFLNLDARSLLRFREREAPDQGFSGAEVAGWAFEGLIVFTGALDELCNERFGLLPYRSVDFVYRHYEQRFVQPCGTVNFTVSEDYTRTSEYTWLTGQEIDKSSVAEEYPRPYEDTDTQIPYYPIVGDENLAFYKRYLELFSTMKNFYLLGRLAEYRYYNMDQIVLRALELTDGIIDDTNQ